MSVLSLSEGGGFSQPSFLGAGWQGLLGWSADREVMECLLELWLRVSARNVRTKRARVLMAVRCEPGQWGE